jgi:hypothetical protein
MHLTNHMLGGTVPTVDYAMTILLKIALALFSGLVMTALL